MLTVFRGRRVGRRLPAWTIHESNLLLDFANACRVLDRGAANDGDAMRPDSATIVGDKSDERHRLRITRADPLEELWDRIRFEKHIRWDHREKLGLTARQPIAGALTSVFFDELDPKTAVLFLETAYGRTHICALFNPQENGELSANVGFDPNIVWGIGAWRRNDLSTWDLGAVCGRVCRSQHGEQS